MFKERKRPFVLVYWSRDPDGSQHNQGDRLMRLVPGVASGHEWLTRYFDVAGYPGRTLGLPAK